jgi:predicted enzyme related to lactoylglutathione lyase
MKNIINWFEIAVSDYERAKKFYEEVFLITFGDGSFGDWKMAFFPAEGGSVSGALVYGPTYKPTSEGALIYLNCNPDLNVFLSRVEAADGKIERPKTLISEDIGYWACVIDTEGNRIAFHSHK